MRFLVAMVPVIFGISVAYLVEGLAVAWGLPVGGPCFPTALDVGLNGGFVAGMSLALLFRNYDLL